MWTSAHLHANGINLRYHRTGGGKPPVVLLHGITDNGLCWTRVAQALESDYDVIMPDARGHGESDKPASGYRAEDHAADVASLIELLGLHRPVLLGHSMGADVAAHVAALYPILVGGLIAEDPPWRLNPQPESERHAFIEGWRQGIIHQRTLSTETLINQTASHWHMVERENWAVAHQQVVPEVLQYRPLPPDSWQAVLELIQCPMLLVIGDKPGDAILNLQDAQTFQRVVPGMQIAQIRQTGHSIHRDNFEDFISAVRGFLNQPTSG